MTSDRKKRLIERVKSLLIVLLSFSAVLLALRTQDVMLEAGEQRETYLPSGGQAAAEAGTVRPLRMAAAARRGSEVVRYGAQYSQEAVDALFQQSYSLLVEALSSAGAPRSASEEEWLQALSGAPVLFFDWQGEIPMAVLSAWLSVDNPSLSGTVRRLVLTAAEGQVLLYYWDESAGEGRVCVSDVIGAGRLEEAVSAWQENGAVFAFESEDYAQLAPETMVLPQPPEPAVYSASNPLDGQAVQELQEQLGFPESSVSYTAAGEKVVRSRNDTLHLGEDGRVTYEAAAEGSDRYHLAGADLCTAEESCRQLAWQTVGTRCGEAELYLSAVQETEAGWKIDFAYQLDGVPVRLSSGAPAASFLVEQGQITWFQLQFRSYAGSGSVSAVLPERQAVAAMEAVGHAGEELLLLYWDGGELASASWAAAGSLDRGR